MDFIFFSKDRDILSWARELKGSIYTLSEVHEIEKKVGEVLEKGDEDSEVLLFMDYDSDFKALEKVNKKIGKEGRVIRILMTSKMTVRELKKHQKGANSTHGYLMKPLTPEVFQNILDDLDLKETYRVFENEGDDTDLQTNKAFEFREMRVHQEVEDILSDHEASMTVPSYKSSLNDNIQKKFNRFFDPPKLLKKEKEGEKKKDLDIDLGEHGGEEFDFSEDEGIDLLGQEGEEVDLSEEESFLRDGDHDFDELEEGDLSFSTSSSDLEEFSKSIEEGDLSFNDSSELEALKRDKDQNKDQSKDESKDENEGESEGEGEDFLETTISPNQLERADDTLALEFADSDISGMDLEESATISSVEVDSEEEGELDFLGEEVEKEEGEKSELLPEEGTAIEDFELGQTSFSVDEEEDSPIEKLQEAKGDEEREFQEEKEEDQDILEETLAGEDIEDFSDLFQGPQSDEEILEDSSPLEEEIRGDERHFKSSAQGEKKQEVSPSFYDGEAIRLQGTVRQLREEREALDRQMEALRQDAKIFEQENLNSRSEFNELKGELSVIKKRHLSEVDEIKKRLRVADERKLLAEERARSLQKDLDRLQQKVRMDFNQIRAREKELEGQLELVKMDTEIQVQSRDKKILELKRKIDQLEFNMENAVIREQKSRDDKMKLEERLERMMRTLRGSIEVLEDDIDREASLRKGHKS